MKTSLVVMSLAAFTLVALLFSGAAGAALPWLDRVAIRMRPRHRARLWLCLASLPCALAAMAVFVSFLPALGFGPDHCLDHGPHHPHLCPHHVSTAPNLTLVAIGALMALRTTQIVIELGLKVRLSYRTSRALAQGSDDREGMFVFRSRAPQAFVLGSLRPRVHVSSGLLALGSDVVEPVLAHERVHVARRDLLWRVLFLLIAAGHLPWVATALRSRFCASQELAADSEAAETLPGGRLKVAEALLTVAKLARSPSPALSFTHGDLTERVRALLEPPRPHSAWPARALIIGGLAVPLAIGLTHDVVHHVLETVLGVLS